MFRFFDNPADEEISYLTEIPEELTLKIFQHTPPQAQANLVQTCKSLNRIGAEPALALNQINSTFPGRKLIHSVGDTHLLLKEKQLAEKSPSFFSYSIFTIRELKTLPQSSMSLGKETAEEYAAAMKGGTLPLLQKLDAGGKTAKVNAVYLKTALGIFAAKDEEQHLSELNEKQRSLADARGPHVLRRS